MPIEYRSAGSQQLLEAILNEFERHHPKSEFDLWHGKRIGFLAALVRVMVFLRDQGYLALSAAEFSKYLELGAIGEVVFDPNEKYGEQFPLIVLPLKSYLRGLPKFDPANLKCPNSETLDWHRCVTRGLAEVFNDE